MWTTVYMFCFSNYKSCCCKGYGTTLHPGTRLLMKSAATSAFGRPTSLGLNGPIMTVNYRTYEMLNVIWFYHTTTVTVLHVTESQIPWHSMPYLFIEAFKKILQIMKYSYIFHHTLYLSNIKITVTIIRMGGNRDETYLKRNCLLRLDTSIVSMSTTWIRRNPDRA